MISKDGIAVNLKKVIVVQGWKQPPNIIEIKNFLGLAGYYQKFIEKFLIIAASMTRLWRKDATFT